MQHPLIGRAARLSLAAALVAVLAVAATATAAPAPIIIGFVGAKTGFMSTYDQQVLVGAQLAAKKVNAAGGLLGGRQIQFIYCDSQTSESQEAVCAQQVLSKGAEFVMPSCDYDFGGPAARAAVKAGVVAIGCAGGLAYGVQGVGPLLFNTYSGSATESSIMAEWAYTKMKWRHPYVITDQYLQYTKDVGTYFTKRWGELAGSSSIVGQDTFNNTDASVAPQISRLKSAVGKADFIVLASLPPGGATFIKQIRAAGINLPIVGAAAFDGSYWLSTVPNLSNFYYPAIGSLYGKNPDPLAASVLAEYKSTTGKAPPTANYPLLGYAAIQTLAKGMQIAKTTDGATLAKALDTFKNVPLVTGPTTYTATCHIPADRPYLIMQVQHGKGSYTGIKSSPKSVPPHPC